MSFNPDLLDTRLPALGGFGLLELSGTDAASFAQAQFMNHVGALAPGQWHWSGWLTPKGRVIALFALVKYSDDRLWLVVPDYPAVDLAAGLGRYVFRTKVKIEVRHDWVACADLEGRLAPPPGASILEGDHERGCVLDFGGDAGPRRLVLVPRSHPAVADGDPATDAAWRLSDLRHGLPRLGREQVEAWTPHMLSLDRLDAFSVRKGCYPGQEIVARTHFLGQSKRGLVRLTAAMPVPVGAEVRTPEGLRLGDVVCCADAGDVHEALAVVPVETSCHVIRAGEVLARCAPLLGGLAR